VIAATAGRIYPEDVPSDVFVAGYPWTENSGTLYLIICNNGSLSAQQALIARKRYGASSAIWIASKRKNGAVDPKGLLPRAHEATAGNIRRLVSAILGNVQF